MEKLTKDVIIGGLIVLVGILLLLINLDVIDFTISGSFIAGMIFFIGFGVFIGIYLYQNRKEFWPLIPAFVLLGLSILIVSDEIGISGPVGAGIFILFIGLGFIMIYLFHRENWWAIIPGGIIGSVSMVIFVGDISGVGLMFLGMGGTFIVLYPIINKIETESWWTLIPGSILAIMGLLFLIFDRVYIGQFIIPIALIIIGGVLITRSVRKK